MPSVLESFVSQYRASGRHLNRFCEDLARYEGQCISSVFPHTGKRPTALVAEILPVTAANDYGAETTPELMKIRKRTRLLSFVR